MNGEMGLHIKAIYIGYFNRLARGYSSPFDQHCLIFIGSPMCFLYRKEPDEPTLQSQIDYWSKNGFES